MDWRWVCRRISSSGTTTLWTWNIYNKIHQLLYQLSQSLQLTSYRSHVSISCPKLYHVSQKYYNCTRNGFSCPDTIFHSTWPAINISIQFSLNLNLYCSLIPLGRPYFLERWEKSDGSIIGMQTASYNSDQSLRVDQRRIVKRTENCSVFLIRFEHIFKPIDEKVLVQSCKL